MFDRSNICLKRIILVLSISVICVCFMGCNTTNNLQSETNINSIKKGGFTVNASVHDPAIVVGEDGMYYIFGSHMEAAKSSNLHQWISFASGVNAKNPLFSNLFDENMDAFSYVGKHVDGGYAVWAPDVIYNKKMQKWVMYFCTSHDYQTSNLCFAIADKIEGPYEYQDTFLYSGFTIATVEKTNFFEVMGTDDKHALKGYIQGGGYNHSLYPNCIDPTVFYDAEGRMWMVYGSWSGGIFLLEIDEETGYPIHPEADEENGVDRYFGKHLVGGLHNSCEGPYILYDEQTKYYYLFVSYGGLTSNGGYQIRVYRSKKVDGPYVDTRGQNLGAVIDHSSYGLKMMGNYTFPSLIYTYMAPGHNSAFIDKDGKMYLVYHQRFDDGQEYHEPRVHQMFINENGWPVAAPFATCGETLQSKGYSNQEVAGTYYYLNHETDIGDTVHESQEIVWNQDGTITQDNEKIGNYVLKKNAPYVVVTIGEQQYDGVMIQMQDEAGNQTMCFTACGKDNKTIWGVHYQ